MSNATKRGEGAAEVIGGKIKKSMAAGKIGWALLWLLGIPLPVLVIVYLIRGH